MAEGTSSVVSEIVKGVVAIIVAAITGYVAFHAGTQQTTRANTNSAPQATITPVSLQPAISPTSPSEQTQPVKPNAGDGKTQPTQADEASAITEKELKEAQQKIASLESQISELGDQSTYLSQLQSTFQYYPSSFNTETACIDKGKSCFRRTGYRSGFSENRFRLHAGRIPGGVGLL